MGTFRLATSRLVRNPVRVQTWNGSIRAGDDFKLALTVFTDDSGTPAQVAGSRSRLTLWPDRSRGFGSSPDYGFAWFTGGSLINSPGIRVQTDGLVTPVRDGGINFAIPASTTAGMWLGRYRLVLQVDLPDGEFSQVEGILQVRERWQPSGLGHTPGVFFQLDVSQLDLAILAPVLVGGVPVDDDGFFLLTSDFQPVLPANAPLDEFVLDRNQLA
jgi:hypothetical protein